MVKYPREMSRIMEYKLTKGLPVDAKLIRRKVFVEEQGFQNEFDETDSRAVHAVVYENGRPAATGRLFESGADKTMIIGRVAVLKEFRGKGLGGAVISALEEKAREKGAKELELTAQTRVKEFYEHLGYVSSNEQSYDEGVPHIKMRKTL